MVLDPKHKYSNEAERADKDIYDDFKLKNTFGLHGLHLKILQRCKGKTAVTCILCSHW